MTKRLIPWLLSLAACAPPAPVSPVSPASAPSSPASVAPPEAPRPAPSAAAPAAFEAPRIALGPDGVALDGERVAEPPRRDRLGKVEGLFEALKARRERWRSARAGEPFPGRATLVVPPSATGLALLSTFQTTTYAGYPHITLVLDGEEAPFTAQIPGRPCGGDCPPTEPGRTAHVGLEASGFRLKIIGADEAATERGPTEGPMAEVLDALVAEGVRRVVVHLDPAAIIADLAPDLLAAARFGADRLDGAVLSVRPFVQGGAVSKRPRAKGRLDPAEIQRVVRAHFTTLRGCYEKELVRDPSLQGRAVVRFEIELNGHVGDASASSEVFPPSLDDCLVDAFRELVFPRPEGGTVIVSYPIVFTPGN